MYIGIIEKSNKYDEIVEAYEKYKDVKSKTWIWNIAIQKIDPELHSKTSAQNFICWINRQERKREENSRIQLMQRTGALEVLQSDSNAMLSELELSKVKSRIRKYAAALFENQLINFLNQPERGVGKMTFAEALKLYKLIRSEEDSAIALKQKEQQDKFDNLFTFFRLQSMYGNNKSNPTEDSEQSQDIIQTSIVGETTDDSRGHGSDREGKE